MIAAWLQAAEDWNALATNLMSDPVRLFEIQGRQLEDWGALWAFGAARAMGQRPEPLIEPGPDDHRFDAPAWTADPTLDLMKQAHLLSVQQACDLIGEADLDAETQQRLKTLKRQAFDALSPDRLIPR